KVSIDIADRSGADLRRLLRSAERFSDTAMSCALRFLNTPCSRSSASLSRVTLPDHFLSLARCRAPMRACRPCVCAVAAMMRQRPDAAVRCSVARQDVARIRPARLGRQALRRPVDLDLDVAAHLVGQALEALQPVEVHLAEACLLQ